jgi:hypothetical protein
MNGQKKEARDRVIEELQQQLKKTQEALEKANRRIEELEKRLDTSPTTKFDEPFSVDAEESRQEKRGKKKKRKSPKKRKGRITTAEKVAQAARTERVYPQGVAPEDCQFSHTRPVWRIENGQAVLLAYEIYRGPNNQYGKIPGVLGRSEFGIEIVITLAYQVYTVGLSFDKACCVLNFFQNLKLRKSQADALLRQLARHWESEFEVLCTLLANSMVVHTDETGWSINSVWAFLSEKVRLLVFGVHKDAATLANFLDPETFGGTVISDDAAVYANFSSAQKCWAHLLRKAIKLTLIEPDNEEYRRFTDRLLEIYRKACRLQRDKRYSDAGREAKVGELDDEILALCAPIWVAELPPQEEEALDNYRKLANELMRLMLAQQLFTFVTGGSVAQPNGESSAMSGTNNEAERSLRGAANARKTGRTSKTTRGAKRRTVTESVLESLRVHLPTFTLSSILTEIERWSENGRSCFTELLEKLKLPPPKTSILDALFPPLPPSKA